MAGVVGHTQVRSAAVSTLRQAVLQDLRVCVVKWLVFGDLLTQLNAWVQLQQQRQLARVVS
jgi:hypothetical protein